VHATSDLVYAVPAGAVTFRTDLGVDDEVGTYGSVVFQVWVDGVKRWDSGRMTGTSATARISVDVRGARQLRLVVTDGGDGNGMDHADWAAPVFAGT